MKIDEDKIFKSISSKEYPSGRHCNFVKLSDNWGLKVYKSEKERDFCYKNQLKCSKIGCGPEVGELVDLQSLDMYAYITEVIDTFPEDYYACDDMPDEIAEETQIGINEAISEVYEKTGWYMDDGYVFNFGKKDGKIMILDFGS